MESIAEKRNGGGDDDDDDDTKTLSIFVSSSNLLTALYIKAIHCFL